MQSQSPECCGGPAAKAPGAPGLLTAALVLSSLGFGAPAAIAQSRVQDAAADVAYVESVSGRVVALARAAPVLIDALDMISDRTRLDLQPNSEVRLCHYRMQRLLTLRGPARASVSTAGATLENGKAVEPSDGICAMPVVSNFQGGLVARGGVLKTTNVPLQPSIKVVNRGTVGINRIALLDSEEQTIVGTFERHAARPTFDNGRSYVLVVERSDGSELRMILKGNAMTRPGPVFVVVQ
jgi:hypothetical protein